MTDAISLRVGGVALRARAQGQLEYRGELVRSGRIRSRTDGNGRIVLPENVLREAVEAGLFENLACFIDHSWDSSLRDLFGTWRNVIWEDGAAVGTLRLYESADNVAMAAIIDQVIGEGADAPDLGTSLVFYPFWSDSGDDGVLVLGAFQKIESCDLVFMPAAKSRLLQKLSAEVSAREIVMDSVEDVDVVDGKAVGAEWLSALAAVAVPGILANSGLPAASVARLGAGVYANAAALTAAIDAEKAYLAALNAENVVQLGDAPRRGIVFSDIATALDRAKNDVGWFFGVEGASTPAYNYRRFDQLYVAMTGDVAFTGVFDGSRTELSASPITLPNLAIDAMNTIVRAQFSRLRYYRWYELVATVEPNDGTLHDAKWIIYGGTGDLPVVADGAAYTEGNIDDSKETAAFNKRGRYVGITRAMIKNSDIAKIRAVPRALATDSVRTRSAQVAALFTQNSGVGPTLADGNALFHSSRTNVATTALGTDTTAWEAASRECFAHVEVGSGKSIATFAKYAFVPAALYFQALKNFGYGDGNPTTYNPFAVADRSPEDPRPVVLAVPDFSDATDWAYVADPMIWPVIEMSYSQQPGGGSHPEPELFTVMTETGGLMFTNDIMPIKVRDEFAIGVNGGAGIGKRNVA